MAMRIDPHLGHFQAIFFSYGATAPSGPGPPHYQGFTITLRHTTLGRILWMNDQPDENVST